MGRVIFIANKSKDYRIYLYAIVISILVHLLGLGIFAIFDVFAVSAKAKVPQPIVLEMQPPKPKPQLKPKPKQKSKLPLPIPKPSSIYEDTFVENKNADGYAPLKNTYRRSTKSSRSAAPAEAITSNWKSPALNPSAKSPPLPEVKNFTQPPEDNRQKVRSFKGNSKTLILKKQRRFSKSFLKNALQKPVSSPQKKNQTPQAKSIPRRFKDDLFGKFRVDTQADKWAVWFLAFQKKLRPLWYVPTAWNLGLIDGKTILKLKISREGQLIDFKVIGHIGHPSLKKSSVNVIKSVLPFKASPPDIPGKYEEIIYTLTYPNIKELYRQRSTN